MSDDEVKARILFAAVCNVIQELGGDPDGLDEVELANKLRAVMTLPRLRRDYKRENMALRRNLTSAEARISYFHTFFSKKGCGGVGGFETGELDVNGEPVMKGCRCPACNHDEFAAAFDLWSASRQQVTQKSCATCDGTGHTDECWAYSKTDCLEPCCPDCRKDGGK